MEDQVPFKVYTYYNENERPEVRRFGIDKTVVTSYQYWCAKLKSVFPTLKNKNFTVSWKDEEGDNITISSDDEIMIALGAMSDDLVKLHIFCTSQEPEIIEPHITVTIPDNAPAPHLGVICDGCESPVVGFRYKCASCDDFDLCSTCETRRLHPEHCMVRIPVPNLPSSVIRTAAKRYRQFLKTVSVPEEEHCKKQRRDRSGDRKRREHHGHGHRHHGDGEHYRRTRSWLETFAKYMNEFADLAGDGNVIPETSGPKSTTQEPNQTNQEQPQIPKADSKARPKTSTPAQCLFNVENMGVQDIQKLLGTYLSGFNTSTPQAKPSSSEDVHDSNAQQSVQSESTNNDDVEMGESGEETTEIVKETVTSDLPSGQNTESKKDESPEKADGWTVINTEKDLMDTYGKSNASEPPIGFNLPMEFQERVNISQGQNLYPPLNTATAVLNPKEPERPIVSEPSPKQAQASAASATATATASAAAASAPLPSPPSANKPEAQPKPKPRKRHPLPHIDAAIEQMLGMGFTNDGGWLTQLLESKNGNIAAVLDLLTPVTPKK